MKSPRWGHQSIRRLAARIPLGPTFPRRDPLRLCSLDELRGAITLLHARKSRPDSQTYADLLHACARLRSLADGQSVHGHLLAHVASPDMYLTNHLINLYGKCGSLDHARKLFDEMPRRNVVSWTALLSGYDQYDRPDDCFRMFIQMLHHHLPNEFAYGSVFSSRARSRDLLGGRQVHSLAVKTSFDMYVIVGNALITMYFSCSESEISGQDGWLIFQHMTNRNLVTWNSMIGGFSLLGRWECSFEIFVEMHREGIVFDFATLVSVVLACSDMDSKSLIRCRQVHSLAVRNGFINDVEVATALLKAYAKLGGEVDDCYRVFLETKQPDVVSWTGIMTAFAESKPEEAIGLFRGLRREGLNPDCYTFSIVVKACASLATARHGSAVHAQISKAGYEGDVVLANALIHLYSRCGALELSERVFDQMLVRDIVSWNSMIKAYAVHGRGIEAIRLFSNMDVKPDPASFVGLLSACAHSGLVTHGLEFFDAMVKYYGIAPQREHFACMVDILGRAGHLTEAEDLINRMTMEPDSVVWSALLGACRKHGENKIGERAAQKLIKLVPKNSIGYVMMSNIYCSKGSFMNAGFVRKEMKERRAKKEPGLSWIEIDNRVHEFASGGRRHPQREAICREVEDLVRMVKERGYLPETSLVLHEVEEEHKEEQLFYHSEKLALAFCLMSNVDIHSTIRIMKNIRICLDCHNFMKLASGCIGREIMVRDANRFHHFREGTCSCNDYW